MYGFQALKLDNTQLQKKKQDLVHCNNSFGMLLSSMESLFIKSGYSIKVSFGHYNHFNDVSWKTKEEIRAQLHTDLLAYKIQKIAYTQKYGKFDFPDEPPIEEIIKTIQKWKSIANDKQEKNLCDEILDLINDTNQKPISYYQSRVENVQSSTRADPIESVIISNIIHNKIDKRNNEINSKIEKNPNSKFGLKMDEKPGNSEFSDIKITKKKTKDTQISKNENDILKKVEDLIKLVDEFFEPKDIKDSEIEQKLGSVSKCVENYHKKNNNINFLFTKIHKDKTIKTLNDKIKIYEENIKLLKNIKNMLTKYDEY